MSKIIIICGSTSDFDFANKIKEPLEKNYTVELHAASAHKEPVKVLEIIKEGSKNPRNIFITIAGRSNALSGFVGANSNNVTIACPPFADKVDYLVNIHSTLQMPSKTPVLTVIDAGNCVLCVERLMNAQK